MNDSKLAEFEKLRIELDERQNNAMREFMQHIGGAEAIETLTSITQGVVRTSVVGAASLNLLHSLLRMRDALPLLPPEVDEPINDSPPPDFTDESA